MNVPFPAHLWIGNTKEVLNAVVDYLHGSICASTNKEHCFSCTQIKNKQHYKVLWFSTPNKPYLMADFEPIFQRLLLKTDETCFFIIEAAHMLSESCANSLLKSLEEPPEGYHFILIADSEDLILPTIKSRCIISYIHTKQKIYFEHPLFTFFSDIRKNNSPAFSKTINQLNINELEFALLLEQLLQHWTGCLKNQILQSKEIELHKTKLIIDVLHDALKHPPMPGGTKIALKNLFLEFQQKINV